MCLMPPRREPPIEFVDRRPIRKVYLAPSPRRSINRTRISDTIIRAEPPAAQYVQGPAPPPPPPAPASASAPKELAPQESAPKESAPKESAPKESAPKAPKESASKASKESKQSAPKDSAPKVIKAPSPPPPPAPAPPTRVELVEVEEGLAPEPSRSNASGSRRSASHRRERRSSRSRGAGEEREVYIERERERIRGLGAREEPPDTFRYVEGLPPPLKETRFFQEGPRAERRERSRSITYASNPRHSGRLVERERVLIEDGGRRRESYQRR